ncbi:MAG: hypothetical protein VKK97_04040 [Synechococcaceae cyanobacterium]|nr:hypothetical protein [Synechococcaceae cyanobacterium]
MKIMLFGVIAVLAFGLGAYEAQNRELVALATRQQATLETMMTELKRDERLLQTVLGSNWDRSKGVISTAVTVSCYSSRRVETDSTPWTTADGSPTRPGIIAISRDLLRDTGIRMGSRVVIEGYGAFEVRDVMNSRWTRRVDIWVADATAAKRHGVKPAKLVWQG